MRRQLPGGPGAPDERGAPRGRVRAGGFPKAIGSSGPWWWRQARRHPGVVAAAAAAAALAVTAGITVALTAGGWHRPQASGLGLVVVAGVQHGRRRHQPGTVPGARSPPPTSLMLPAALAGATSAGSSTGPGTPAPGTSSSGTSPSPSPSPSGLPCAGIPAGGAGRADAYLEGATPAAGPSAHRERPGLELGRVAAMPGRVTVAPAGGLCCRRARRGHREGLTSEVGLHHAHRRTARQPHRHGGLQGQASPPSRRPPPPRLSRPRTGRVGPGRSVGRSGAVTVSAAAAFARRGGLPHGQPRGQARRAAPRSRRRPHGGSTGRRRAPRRGPATGRAPSSDQAPAWPPRDRRAAPDDDVGLDRPADHPAAASAASSLPVSRAASRSLQLHQSQRASTGSSTAAGMSATSGPGSTNSSTPAGRLAASPEKLARPGRDQAITGDVDHVAGPDPDQAPRARLGQRLRPQRGDDVRSPPASTRATSNPVSTSGSGGGPAGCPQPPARRDLVPRPGAVAARVNDGQALPGRRGHDVEPRRPPRWRPRPRACRRRVRAARAPTSAGRRSPRRGAEALSTGWPIAPPFRIHRARASRFSGERCQAEALGVDGRDGLGGGGTGAGAGTAMVGRRGDGVGVAAERGGHPGRPATDRRHRGQHRERGRRRAGWPGWCRPGCG